MTLRVTPLSFEGVGNWVKNITNEELWY